VRSQSTPLSQGPGIVWYGRTAVVLGATRVKTAVHAAERDGVAMLWVRYTCSTVHCAVDLQPWVASQGIE
jgi:hypothetical protein